MSKKYITIGLLAGLTAGTGAGLILQQTGAAGASAPAIVQQDDTGTDDTGADDTGTDDTSTTDAARLDRSERLAEVLAPLVADSTLTQAQADGVVDAVVAAGPIGRGPGHHAQGHHGRRGLHLDVVASTLGITVEELRTQLAGGATIADVAGAQTQAVIDALVAEATERIEQGVSDSRLTREEADEKLADLPERIAERVDSPLPSRDGPDGRDG